MPGYCGFCVPSESISHAIRLYQWFCLRFGELEERHAGRGIMLTDETIRQWCRKSGPVYPHKFKKRQGRLGDTYPVDKVFVTIQGLWQYLWRAVDQDADTINILMLLLQRRHQRAAVRFFRRVEQGHGPERRCRIFSTLPHCSRLPYNKMARCGPGENLNFSTVPEPMMPLTYNPAGGVSHQPTLCEQAC
jgi:DDE domain